MSKLTSMALRLGSLTPLMIMVAFISTKAFSRKKLDVEELETSVVDTSNDTALKQSERILEQSSSIMIPSRTKVRVLISANPNQTGAQQMAVASAG